MLQADWCGGNALHSYSGGTWFESWLGQQFLLLKFFVVFVHLFKYTGMLPQLGQDLFQKLLTVYHSLILSFSDTECLRE
jgi:hypothetical protein